jgi:hypothetical protein
MVKLFGPRQASQDKLAFSVNQVSKQTIADKSTIKCSFA